MIELLGILISYDAGPAVHGIVVGKLFFLKEFAVIASRPQEDGSTICRCPTSIFNELAGNAVLFKEITVHDDPTPGLHDRDAFHGLFASFTFYLLRHDYFDLWHFTSQKVND